MMKSLQLFYYYLNESIKEFRGSLKIYFTYALGLCLVSVVQNGIEFYLPKEATLLRIFSKILFSIISMLILSKILYVIKIRHFGIGEYGSVLWRFLLYNFYYFFLILLGVGVYLLTATIVGATFSIKFGFLATSFLLIPVIYAMIYYSLTPIVAVFDDDHSGVFSESQKLSSKNISLVIVNHLCSFIFPAIFYLLYLIENSTLKFSLSVFFAIPEAVVSILMILTTSRIYLHLTEQD